MAESVQREVIEKLQHLLTLSINQSLNPSEDNKSELRDQLSKLDITNETPSNKYSKDLLSLWAQYKNAHTTLSETISSYEKIRFDKKRNGEIWPEFSECYVYSNGAYYALCPHTGDVIEQPLIYPQVPTLDLFKRQIERSPLSNVLNLPLTIKRMMSSAQSKGITRNQFGQLLKLLIKQEVPEYYPAIATEENSRDIFAKVVSLCDFYSEKSKIVESINSIVRRPQDSIMKTAFTFHGLCMELLKMEGGLEEEDIISTADRETCRVLKKLVEPHVWQHLQSTILTRRVRLKEKTDLLMQLDIVKEAEEIASNRISLPKKLSAQDINLAIFNIDITQGRLPSRTPADAQINEDSLIPNEYPLREEEPENLDDVEDTDSDICVLCGRLPGRGHKSLNMCSIYGRSRPTSEKCQFCYDFFGISAYHATEACIDNDYY